MHDPGIGRSVLSEDSEGDSIPASFLASEDAREPWLVLTLRKAFSVFSLFTLRPPVAVFLDAPWSPCIRDPPTPI